MAGKPLRSNEPFAHELPRLLEERNMSLSALARELGVNPSHLSRGVRNVDYKRLSPHLIARIGAFLGCPVGYFPEEREAFVIERIRADAVVRDRLYRRWSANPDNAPGRSPTDRRS